ncbi:hypothetical protein [Aestuariivirga litoralis]|uniref:hypothetical protein n=1 Tax=Aestuariivirga litoralis TaxID=2650924 RepID=UPI0018C59CDE|nr:hypothetical protein [Aestuariivirga litoralis]MBG1232252.1 hypothetical protein [Aestuariivirga litoralis]
MSNVIYLKGREQGRKSRPLPDGMAAEIVIFHGVRFERLTDDMIDDSKVKNRRLPSRNNQAIAEDLE